MNVIFGKIHFKISRRKEKSKIGFRDSCKHFSFIFFLKSKCKKSPSSLPVPRGKFLELGGQQTELKALLRKETNFCLEAEGRQVGWFGHQSLDTSVATITGKELFNHENQSSTPLIKCDLNFLFTYARTLHMQDRAILKCLIYKKKLMEKNWHFHFLLLICHEFAWSCECPAAKSSGCFTDTPPESVLKTLIDSAEDRASSRPANHSVFAVSTDRPNGWVLSNCSSVFALFFLLFFDYLASKRFQNTENDS